MQQLEKILADYDFFRGLPPEAVALLVDCARPVTFEAGEQIFREGDESTTFFLITHGVVVLDVYVPERGPVTIQSLHEGDILGWSWLFSPPRRQFAASAVQLTRAIAFDGPCVLGKCETDPRLGYELMKRFAQVFISRLQATRFQLLDLYGHTARR